ncbi:o-succinylbenzoate synthase [Fusibacter paucivorans]|uniref:o-succinylbenzoate synthase n=1 Tax=Fusibacter paucivorans TaxID=76009 RepID=A0ABS5PLW5_9FIRM|nr:o-succinylbenzoate synthase [Fusibacter paucivorans]MBS7526164.1 o-succinylbenzoate synthase [Fusibacter paucivorans]
MKIEKIVLRKVKITFRTPFETSFARMFDKHFIAVEAHSKDHIGYGDCSAFEHPFYNEETIGSAWYTIENFLVPMLFSQETINHPEDVNALFSKVRRNNMAKSALDCAIWDLYAKENGISVSKALGGTRTEVETGVSIGVQNSLDDLLHVIDGYMKEGYRRVKIKIKPGKDLNYLEGIRKRFGDIMLMVDANSAYTLADLELFKEMDKLNLLMIEQPLSHDDIVDHRHLQAVMNTPICLDESIHDAEDARKAIELGSTKTINIKVARVGGLTEAKKVHDICMANDIPVWCGGMLDTGIARAHNVAVASLPNYKYPGDIPASDRYWERDVIKQPMKIDSRAMLYVPDKPGIGFEPDVDYLDKLTYYKQEIKR